MGRIIGMPDPFNGNVAVEDKPQQGEGSSARPMKGHYTSRWREWEEGAEIEFAKMAEAYGEWIKTIKSSVAPKPSPLAQLGEILKQAGFQKVRHRCGTEGRHWFSILPSANDCLQSLDADDWMKHWADSELDAVEDEQT